MGEFGHGDDPGNPFFTTWTKGVDIMKLLSLVGDAVVVSLYGVCGAGLDGTVGRWTGVSHGPQIAVAVAE